MIKNLLLRKPFLIVFDVTKRCNSKCNMCSIWKHPSKLKDELTLKQIKKIFNELHSFGIKQVLLQGGEPLLRKDIFEIIKLLINIGLKPSLITNGLLLDKKTAIKLSRLKCNVTISFDSLKKERYLKIRGVDLFERVKKNIQFASKIKQKKGNWFLNATISELNQDEIIKLYDFSRKHGFGFFAFPYNYAINKASAKDDVLIFKNKKKIINSFNKLLNKSIKEKDIINELISKEIIEYLKGSYNKPCDALKYSLMLDEQGRISPCIEKPFEFDLKKKSIKEVWPDFNFLGVKQCYLNTPCFYGCTRSTGVLIRGWFNVMKYLIKNIDKIKQLSKLI